VPRLHLVRHGRAAAAWAEHLDPGLDALGRAEAVEAADLLRDAVAVQPVWASPKLRARETAAPLAALWRTEVVPAPAFTEIPSPSEDPQERERWLSSAMVSRWADLGPEVQSWRDELLGAVRALEHDVVVFTHFVAVNAVVGAAGERPEVVVCVPATGSVTAVEVDRVTGALVVVRRGREATPRVG
jgi:broad specificity phosphatase PhoE